MKRALHPQTTVSTVTCGTCGTSFELRSTATDLRVEVCSHCHPAYTGQAQTRATGSQVERFERRWRRPTTHTTP